MKPQTFIPAQRRAAAAAWRESGHWGLSRWLSKVRPRFGVIEYGAAVTAAREELDDWTDYSQENDSQPPRAKAPGLVSQPEVRTP